jgi:hypothetical protein
MREINKMVGQKFLCWPITFSRRSIRDGDRAHLGKFVTLFQRRRTRCMLNNIIENAVRNIM